MKIGIMQPYFFPYIGYFQLIHAVDQWVVFDTPQYIRKGWVNRNRVLKQNGGAKYVGITIAKSLRETAINQVKIAEQNWQTPILNALDYYKLVKAPYYNQTISFLKDTLAIEGDLLAPALIHFIKACCAYIQIPFSYQVFSEMKFTIGEVNEAGDWAFEIAKALNADAYINPPGGKSIFDPEKFHTAGIKLQFIEPKLTPYNQRNESFEPGLSIIDVMMFNSPPEIREMLTQYELS